jgi:hypothetical protein
MPVDRKLSLSRRIFDLNLEILDPNQLPDMIEWAKNHLTLLSL